MSDLAGAPTGAAGAAAASGALAGSILVADDNAVNRFLLGQYIRRQGHHLAMAENGRQAVAMIAAGSFDLLLLDVQMPEMDGYEVLATLKAHPRWRDIPVIVISSLEEIDSAVRCIEMGAEDYLTKPFNAVLLHARIGASLEKKRLRDQEVRYLDDVARVTAAAAAIEAETFDTESLTAVAARGDQLGQLARVFQRMAQQVYVRETRLKEQVQELRIEIDRVRADQQVGEITDTDYFRRLREQAHELRAERTGKTATDG